MEKGDLIILLALGETVNDKVIAEGLYEICDDVHANCNEDCPVNKMNGGEAPDTANDFRVNRGCDCFKDGTAMLHFIRSSKKKKECPNCSDSELYPDEQCPECKRIE